MHSCPRSQRASLNPRPRDLLREHRKQLDSGDLEFLELEQRSTAEVVAYSGIPETSLKRITKNGGIESSKTASGRYRFKTVSVVRYLINAKAEEET